MKIYILNSWYPSDEEGGSDDAIYNGVLFATLEAAQIEAGKDLAELLDDEPNQLEWEPDGKDCWRAEDEGSEAKYSIRLMPVNGETAETKALRNLVTSVKKLNDTPDDPDVGAAIDAAVDNAELLL